jgi:3-oxoacyl-[acyl-carrier-protein] synthase II
MPARRVAVTGLGLVNPYEGDVEDFFAHLLRGDSAVSIYAPDDSPQPLSIPAVHCPRFDADALLGRGQAHIMDRYSQLGTAAAVQAWRDAGMETEDDAERTDAGVAWGTAVGGVLSYDYGYRDLFIRGRTRVPPLSVVLGMNNAAASHIAIKLGLAGPCLTYSVACASSATAIGEAFHRIRRGEVATMLAGGSDAPLAFGVVRAWEALRVLAPVEGGATARACRPFSADRTGLVLGEGAGALVLEDWEHAMARGARIYAEVTGYGCTCDHIHLVKPDANGQVRAMELALADAGLKPDDIDYINAHGTATREGDPTEIAAIRAVFGERAADIPVSATKSMHGHLMGATGAVEAIVSILALRQGSIPPTAHLDGIDPACAGVHHVTGPALTGMALKNVLSNSFAFGGSNAVLTFRSA